MIQKQEIINKIIKLKPFYYLAMRKGRFLYVPVKTIIFYFLVFFNKYSPIKIKIKTKTIYKDKIFGYSSAGIGSIYYLGFQDPKLTLFFLKNVNSGNTFIDIGSNIGYYSLLAKNLVGPKGKIYSFEPTPRTFKILKENTTNFKNIIINQLAVLNKERSVSFTDYGTQYSVFNTLNKRVEKDFFKTKKTKTIKIKTVILDEYCKKNNIKPDFVKIDAEGTEYLILRGMFYILKSLRPIISLEVAGGEEWKENCQESIRILLNNNYQLFEIRADGKLIAHKIKKEYGYDNLVFIPEEKINLYPKLFV